MNTIVYTYTYICIYTHADMYTYMYICVYLQVFKKSSGLPGFVDGVSTRAPLPAAGEAVHQSPLSRCASSKDAWPKTWPGSNGLCSTGLQIQIHM